jgi:hypothetical protein
MDPYLEAHWGDIHGSLVIYARNQLQKQLPKDLRARIEEEVLVEDDQPDDRPQRWKPDVRVVERPNGNGNPAAKTSGNVLVAEPIVVEWEVEPQVLRSVNIVEAGSGHRLVTAVEFMSPTNKGDPRGRRAYRRKQREFRTGGVSLVEVDLLRDGDYVLAVPEGPTLAESGALYRVCVSRGWESGRAELYPLSLRGRLPAIRIPLRETDRDVILDLQPLVDAAYDDGGYDDIDYSVDAEPPLAGDAAAWADQLLREKGKR